MATAGTSATQAAQAVNAVLCLSSNDQGALLELLEDYFTSPDPANAEEDREELDDCEYEVALEGTFVHIIHTCSNH